MSNVTITKSSPADYVDNPAHDTRRVNLDAATDYRPVAPQQRDWQSIAATGAVVTGVLVIVILLYLLFRLSVCTLPWLLWSEYNTTCDHLKLIETYTPYALLVGGAVALVTRGVIWCFQASVKIEQSRIENERFSLLPDRFGNPTPSDLYAGLSPADRFDKYLLLVQLATELKRDTAPHEWVPGSVNNLNLTGPSYNNEPTEQEPADAPILALPAPRAGESILATLRHEGIICRSNNSLHIGNAIDGSGPKYMELKYWGVMAHGGVSRTGKTAWTAYQCCQAYMMGWQLIICDKHAHKVDGLIRQIEPLEEAFLMRPAVNQAETRRNILDVARLGEKRMIELESNPDAIHAPIVLIVDEFANMVLADWLDDEMEAALIRIANEYAGVNIHGIMNAHDWSASVIGKERGAIYRRVTTHRAAHRMDAKGAEFLLPRGYARMAEGLKVGELVYVDDDGAVVVTAPQITSLDVEYAAANRGQHRSPKRSALTQARNDAALAAMLATPPNYVSAVAQSVSSLSVNTHVKPPQNGVLQTTQQTDRQQTEWDQAKKVAILRIMRQQGIIRDDARIRFKALGQGFDNDHWTRAGL